MIAFVWMLYAFVAIGVNASLHKSDPDMGAGPIVLAAAVWPAYVGSILIHTEYKLRENRDAVIHR